MGNKLLAIITALWIYNTSAEPVVIYDSGKTIDAQQFYPFRTPSTNTLRKQISSYSLQPPDIFPVTNMYLTPGKISSKKLSNNYPQALCVVGDDEYSHKWLELNKKKLINISSTCYVISVQSKARFMSIKRIIPEITFIPSKGEGIEKVLNVKHYPFLIHNNSLIQ